MWLALTPIFPRKVTPFQRQYHSLTNAWQHLQQIRQPPYRGLISTSSQLNNCTPSVTRSETILPVIGLSLQRRIHLKDIPRIHKMSCRTYKYRKYPFLFQWRYYLLIFSERNFNPNQIKFIWFEYISMEYPFNLFN